MKPIKKILILCSGGDAPGMNAAIRAAVRSALAQNIEVFAAEAGYCGIVSQKIIPLSTISVANCLQLGGTIIKTGRCAEFHEQATRDQCRLFLAAHQIDGLIVLGGNGSFHGAHLLAMEGGPAVIGIPTTIDNDIPGTDYCIGFDTARNTALSAIDKIRDTAFSLERNFIIEVMGRFSGFLAVDVGIAGGAEFILIPEAPITAAQLVQQLQQQKRQKMSSIIIVAEAGKPGHSLELAKEIAALSGIQYKVCILGHTQRGGIPTVLDRKMGALMGNLAVQALQDGYTHHLVASNSKQLQVIPLPDSHSRARQFTDQSLLTINQIICNT